MAMAGIPQVDPEAPQSFFQRAVRRTIQTKPGKALAMTLSARVDPWLLERTNGRFATGVGFPTLNLTTTGRKSGKPRTATLVYFTRGEDVVLVASSFGRDQHPAWYLNLKADPHAELLCRGHRGRYVARETEGAERDQLFALANRVYAGYSQYAAGTERAIPVLVLSPTSN